MEFFEGFAGNVAASILGGLLLLGLVAFTSAKARLLLTIIFGELTNSDLRYVYANRKEMHEDLVRDLERSKRVYVFTGKGSELQRDTFENLLGKRLAVKNVDFRVLLPETHSSDRTDWAGKNDELLGRMESAYGTGLLQKQIRTTIDYLVEYAANQKVEIGQYNTPHFGRFFVTDRHVYISFYGDDNLARSNPVQKYRVGGPTYEGYLHLFKLLWSDANKVRTFEDII